jgi:hypothetical protein
MTRDDRLNRIEHKLDEVLTDMSKLREQVAQYQGAINILRWVFTIVTVPTLGALIWILKKVGIIVT